MKDVLLDSNGDLECYNGDFVIGDSTLQNQFLLLKSQKGELKEYPTSGVGADIFLLDENKDDLYREIRKEFVKDGMTVKSIFLDTKKIIVDAEYSS